MENVVVGNVRAAAGVGGNGGKNRHGYPQGYRFVPKGVELIRLLDDKLAGRPLPYPLHNIFHDVPILDFHPAELYEAYKAHEEAGFVYFFSTRKFRTPRGARVHPVRVAKDGSWKASGGGKPVSTKKRGGDNVGYELTLDFCQKKSADDISSGKTDWGMHEYTRIIGPNKKVADLALYRLYKKEKSKKREEDQHVATLSNGSTRLKELTPPPLTAGGTCMASTSQAQTQTSVVQPHDCYHQDAFGATASAPGPSCWAASTAADPPMQVHTGCMGLTGSPPAPSMAPSQATTVSYSPTSPQATATPMSPQQQAGDDFDLGDWDSMLPLPPLLAPSTVSGPAPAAHDLPMPTSQQQDAEYPGPEGSNELLLEMLQRPPLPAPATEGYLDDEFKPWGEQQEQPAMSPCWFPMPGDEDLPMLMDENLLYACTLDELFGRDAPQVSDVDSGMHHKAAMSIEEPDSNHQVQSTNSSQ